MTASSSKLPITAMTAALLGFILSPDLGSGLTPGSAWAQGSGTVTAEPLAPPIQLTPLGDPDAPVDNSQRRAVDGIQINPLAATANDAVGTLEPAEGGLGPGHPGDPRPSSAAPIACAA